MPQDTPELTAGRAGLDAADTRIAAELTAAANRRAVLRDARASELIDEPDAVLEQLVDGSLVATDATRELARLELEVRKRVQP